MAGALRDNHARHSGVRLSPLEAALYGPRIDQAALADAAQLLARSLDELSQRLEDARRTCRAIADEIGYAAEAISALRGIIGGRR